MVILLLACTQPETTPVPVAPADPGDDPVADPGDDTVSTEETDLLGPVGALSRASLDLRGIRPSAAEIELVEADPDAYADQVEAFLYDSRFPDRVQIGRAHV